MSGSQLAFLVLLFGLPVVGFLLQNVRVVTLAAVAWPLFYLGLRAGWWGDGTSTSWVVLAVIMGLIGAGSTLAAVVLGRRLFPAS